MQAKNWDIGKNSQGSRCLSPKTSWNVGLGQRKVFLETHECGFSDVSMKQ